MFWNQNPGTNPSQGIHSDIKVILAELQKINKQNKNFKPNLYKIQKVIRVRTCLLYLAQPEAKLLKYSNYSPLATPIVGIFNFKIKGTLLCWY